MNEEKCSTLSTECFERRRRKEKDGGADVQRPKAIRVWKLGRRHAEKASFRIAIIAP